MKKSKCSEQQSAYAPREVERGRPVADVCRMAVSEATWFQDTFDVRCVRACHLAEFSRAAWY